MNTDPRKRVFFFPVFWAATAWTPGTLYRAFCATEPRFRVRGSRPMRVTIVAAPQVTEGNRLREPSNATHWFSVVSYEHMAETEFEKLSRVMVGEFERVHERFDAIDQRFDQIETNFESLASEVVAIHRRLATLEEAVSNIAGFAKEIDHLLVRVGAIEKHLGLTSHIRG